MSETLLDKAFQNLKIANTLRNNPETSDEVYLNYIGYHLQQAVEFAIKHRMEVSGVSFPHEHDISQLILFAKEHDVDCGLTSYIDLASGTLTLWESQTRYIKNYRIELRKIDEALYEVERFLNQVKEKDNVLQNQEKPESQENELELIEKDLF